MLTRLKFIAGEEEVFYTAEVYDKILECTLQRPDNAGERAGRSRNRRLSRRHAPRGPAAPVVRRAPPFEGPLTPFEGHAVDRCANYYGKDGAVDAAALDEVSGEVPPRLIADLWAAIRSKSFERTTAIIETIMLEGFPALATIRRLHDDIVDDENIPDASKADIAEYIARADKNLADSADDALQLQDVVAHILQKLK
jgi:hypothetical protein